MEKRSEVSSGFGSHRQSQSRESLSESAVVESSKVRGCGEWPQAGRQLRLTCGEDQMPKYSRSIQHSIV